MMLAAVGHVFKECHQAQTTNGMLILAHILAYNQQQP